MNPHFPPKRHLAAMILGLALAPACSTSIAVQIRRAPELNLPGVKKVRVEGFTVTGNLSLDVVDTGGGVLGALANVAVDAGVNKLSEGKRQELQTHHMNGFRGVIAGDAYYTVVEGGQDATLGGTVTYDVADKGEATSTKDKAGVERKEYTTVRTAKVAVRLNVVSATGQVLGSTEVSASAQNKSVGADRDAARKNLEAWDVLARRAITDTQQPMLQRIAPYFVTERRTLAKGDADAIKNANEKAGNGDWASASAMWTAAAASGSVADKTAAAYNLGVFAEVEGRLEDAVAKFEEAKKLSGDPKYAGDISRVQVRMDEERRIKAAR